MDPVGHYDHPVRRKFHEGRQFLALYRQRGCVPFRRKRKGHSGREIRPLCKFSERIVLKTLDLTGAGQPSWVSRAHSSFPSSEKQDARHLSKSEFETVLSGLECVKRPVEDAVLRNLRLENLRGAIAELDVQGQNLLSLRYSGELTMEEIGQIYGISTMAVSKRLKKLHEKLGSSVS